MECLVFPEVNLSFEQLKACSVVYIIEKTFHSIYQKEGGNIHQVGIEMSGLNGLDLIGKTLHGIFPKSRDEIIGRYGEVARTGKGVAFKDYNPNFNRHFFNSGVFSP